MDRLTYEQPENMGREKMSITRLFSCYQNVSFPLEKKSCTLNPDLSFATSYVISKVYILFFCEKIMTK